MGWIRAVATLSGVPATKVSVLAAGQDLMAAPEMARLLSRLTHEPWTMSWEFDKAFNWSPNLNLDQLRDWLDGRPALVKTKPKAIVAIRDGIIHGDPQIIDGGRVSLLVVRFRDLSQLEQERQAGIIGRFAPFLPEGVEPMPFDPLEGLSEAMDAAMNAMKARRRR